MTTPSLPLLLMGVGVGTAIGLAQHWRKLAALAWAVAVLVGVLS